METDGYRVHRRIKQPKPTSISEDRRSAAFVQMPTSTFPALSRFFGTLVMAAQIPFVRAEGGISEELSNNIIADLAPFLALFGEQVTKQFMSQSMGIADNIIFAVAPLGIITAIVGAIRVGGSRSLKAIIGRARESRPAVEIELMSSTSTDVCELWDGTGVVRALGAPPIIELIYVIPKKPKYGTIEPETQRILTEGNFGIYDFQSAISGDAPVLEVESPNNRLGESNPGGGAAPNISLNFGGEADRDLEFLGVAVFGVILQLGVLVYAALSFVLSPWDLKFQKDGYDASIYAPIMISGTVALVIGMYLCSHIIERSTVERLWIAKGIAQAEVQVGWLQQGGVFNDQLFDSYALFPNKPEEKMYSWTQRLWRSFTIIFVPFRWFGSIVSRRMSWAVQFGADKSYHLETFVTAWAYIRFHLTLDVRLPIRWKRLVRKVRRLKRNRIRNRNPRLSIRTSRQATRANQYRLVGIAVLVSLCGFIGQFLGLRGLHWSVTVAQMVATCIMTVLRASIRRTLVHKPKTTKLIPGYELDWMAREGIKSCTYWSVVTWGVDRPIHAPDKPDRTLAAATMTARRRLAALSKWPSQWRDTVNSTTEAIEECMNFMFSGGDITIQSNYWSKRDRFEWKIVVEVSIQEPKTAHLEEIILTLKRTKHLDGPWGPWRAVKSEIEAVLGLWMLHFKDLESLIDTQNARASGGLVEGIQNPEASDWQGDEDGLLRGKLILRVLGPYDGFERITCEHWMGRKTNYLRIADIRKFAGGNKKGCDTVIAGPREPSIPLAPVVGVITTTILQQLCGQIIFSQFMDSVAQHLTIGGKWIFRQGGQGVKSSFGLSCAGVTSLVEIVEQSGLANTHEAYMSIVPAVSRHGKLPMPPNDTQAFFSEIVKAINAHIRNGEFEEAEWFRLWLLHVAELVADVYKCRKDWRRAGEVYSYLRQESENLLGGTDHLEEVNIRVLLFSEVMSTTIAIGGRVQGRAISDTVELVGTCMVKVFGDICETALSR